MDFIKRNIIFLVKHFLLVAVFLFASLLSSANEGGNIIINNEAQSKATNQNVLTAPMLIPSGSDQMRSLRQKQEIDTEDNILKELEKQRILDERKRFHSIFNKKESSSVASTAPPASSKIPYSFGEKSFLTLGAGLMNYYNVININSTESPAFLGSFGAYGYDGQLIFDTIFFYSVHYLKIPNRDYQNIRERVNEPGLAMAVKWSFLKGKMKPYFGLTAALIARKWKFVSRDGTELDSPELQSAIRDISKRRWNLSANAGFTFGADVALGERLGLNLDIRWLANFYTENRKTLSQILTDEDLLDERDVILGSLNLKYYFN